MNLMPSARHSSAYWTIAAGSFGEMVTQVQFSTVRNDSSPAFAMAPV